MQWILIVLITLIPVSKVFAGESTKPQETAMDAATVSADQQAIIDLYAHWRSAVENADIPSYISVLHPDIRLIPPGAEVIHGAKNYQGFLGPVFEVANYRIDVAQHPRVDVLGDIAVAEYAYVIHLELHDSDNGVDQPGALTASRTEARYLDVLRKNKAGQWKVWRHTWH